jgi:selenocysteine-specific elongation factor
MTPDRVSSVAPAARSAIFGTAGHIDHGKTALVRALTGIDTDRLPEEKRRGITIDLGFAALEMQAPDGSTLHLSFVDVPGHARFVRNMLAGASGIDAVLMVISAEEGVKPQTEEHLAICSLLGIERGITVLAKADAVSRERLLETTTAVKSFVRGTLLAGGPVVAVSAHSGSGIAALRHELIRLASGVPARSRDAVLRLPVDRAFAMRGFGTVVTGTLIGGSIRAGDELAVLPGNRTARVRGIQIHGRTEREACAGSRVALNLAGIERAELGRGDILVGPTLLHAVDLLDVELSVLRGASLLKHRTRVHFHAYASECAAIVTLYDAKSVASGETRLARLRLSQPVALLPGDRFVLRMGTPITTIGGGRVLDVSSTVQMRKTKTAEWLRTLRAASSEERVWLRIARRGTAGVSEKELSRETGITEAALGGLVQRWIREGRVHLIAEKCLLTPEALTVARETILRHFGARNGDGAASVRRSELREQTGLACEVFDDALQRMEEDRQLQTRGQFVMSFAAADLSGQDGAAISRIAEEFERAGITPPSPDELGVRLGIAPAEMRRLTTLLLRAGTLVRLSDDAMCMHRRSLEALSDKLRGLRGQTLDIAAFKQLAGVSRKYAIPLLEYLDRERITMKQGSQRLVL